MRRCISKKGAQMAKVRVQDYHELNKLSDKELQKLAEHQVALVKNQEKRLRKQGLSKTWDNSPKVDHRLKGDKARLANIRAIRRAQEVRNLPGYTTPGRLKQVKSLASDMGGKIVKNKNGRYTYRYTKTVTTKTGKTKQVNVNLNPKKFGRVLDAWHRYAEAAKHNAKMIYIPEIYEMLMQWTVEERWDQVTDPELLYAMLEDRVSQFEVDKGDLPPGF